MYKYKIKRKKSKMSARKRIFFNIYRGNGGAYSKAIMFAAKFEVYFCLYIRTYIFLEDDVSQWIFSAFLSPGNAIKGIANGVRCQLYIRGIVLLYIVSVPRK